MKLVVAEKNSVGKAIAEALGAKTKKDGYYEGNGYIVSWAVGHLLAPAEPDSYDPKYKKWQYEDLPIIPDKWKYIPAEKTKKQLKILLELMKRSDVDAVINGCDAGREGELIFRLIYMHCPVKKTMHRLWISSMEEAAILDGFKNLRPGKDFDNLYYAALCRQRADWQVGMNFSRLFSVIYGNPLRVGRVQTPTLAMMVDREHKIRNFIKEPFYVVELEGQLPKGTIVAERQRLNDRAEAEAIAAKCNGKTASIDEVTTKRKTTSPQALYDLTTLQREANRLFGFTASQTLEIAQSLYEKKEITYPRTDSRYLSDDMLLGLPQLIKAAISVIPYDVSTKVMNTDPKQVINSSKVTDHHAIIPTASISPTKAATMTEDERKIFMMICTRLVSAVSEKHIYDETAVKTGCEGELFSVKGKSIVQWGWKGIEQAFAAEYGKKANEEEPLPKVTEGMKFPASTAVREGFTSPPKHFTEDTLLSAMENASADDMPEDAERRGLGTPATRAAIIEGLIKGGLVERKKKNLHPTEKGISLINVLPDSVKSPKMTADWEWALKDIEQGDKNPEGFMSEMTSMVRRIIEEHPPSSVAEESKGKFGGSAGESVGKCPRCESDVTDKPKGFFCTNRSCKFALFKDNKFFASKKKKLTKTMVVKLLRDGRVDVDGLHSEKKDKTYSATILLDASGDGWPQFKMEFKNK